MRGTGIEPLHCRVGCRINGGFLECINDEFTVQINGVPRSRARLSNGDRIRIGLVELDVELPEAAKKRAFEISFDEEDSPDAIVGTGTNKAPFSGVMPSEDVAESACREEIIKPLATEIADSEADASLVEGKDCNDETGEDQPLNISNSEGSLERSDEGSEALSLHKSEEAVFEFDSVDAEETSLTAEDLETARNHPAPPSAVEDSVGIAPQLAIAENDEREKEKNTETETVVTSDPISVQVHEENIFPGGSFQGGKYWRWASQYVISTLELLEHRDDTLECYLVGEHVELSRFSFEEVRNSASNPKEDLIFLVSDSDPDDLTRHLIAKRWNERMRHPEALNMSISILPDRMVKSLFKQIDTVVLIQKGEASLLRVSNQLIED